jgi:diguanylate cyclase (GGDEF)-like protein/PAS domain S-box-containing protein
VRLSAAGKPLPPARARRARVPQRTAHTRTSDGKLPDELFEAGDDRRLDAAALEQTLESLLALYPEAPVAALSSSGIFLEMPASVPLRRNPVLRGRAGLDGLAGEDRERVLANWDQVLRVGAGRCPIRPAGYPQAMFYALDVREAHGVIFGLFVRTDAAAARPPRPDDEATLLPRFATVRKDELGFITGVDDATTQILGWTAAGTRGHRSLDFVHPDDHALAVDNWTQMLASPGPARRVRQRLRHGDGHWVWFEITNHNLLEDSSYGCVVCEMVDISDEMATHEALRTREQLLDRLAATVPVGLFQFDTSRQIVYTNLRLQEILGVEAADTVDDQLDTVVATDREILHDAIARVLERGAEADVEVALHRSDSHARRVCTISLRALTHEDGEVSGAIACVADITDSVDMRDELKQRATFDELTGCYNRSSIMRALDHHVAGSEGTSDRAVLFIDLDDFKAINDRRGHAAGDHLLRDVAQRLRAAVRSDDLVGRIGGDEFLVMCPGIGGADAAMTLAKRAADALPASHPRDGRGGKASIGVAWSRGPQLTADELVARADRAMYETKARRTGQPTLASTEHDPSQDS